MVLSKGACIYFGPRREVISYFASLGFPCPPAKATPDFIEELSALPHKFYVGTPMPKEIKANGEDLLIPATLGIRTSTFHVEPLSMESAWKGLIKCYKASEAYEDVGHVLFHEMEPEFQVKKSRMEYMKIVRFNTSMFEQIRLCFKRQATITMRNVVVLRGNLIRQVIIALLLGSLFWQIGVSQGDSRTRFGLLFFVLSFISNVATQLIPVLIRQRPIFYNQSKAGYFHGVAYYLAHVGVNVPQSLVETFLFSIILYPMSGLRGDVFISGYFWFFWLLLFLLSINASKFDHPPIHSFISSTNCL
jgi:hypothetical protein